MTSPDEPIDEDVPLADAVDQRREVTEPPSLSEDFEPTEVSEIASEAAPVDVDPADWQDQHTSAPTDWEPEVDL